MSNVDNLNIFDYAESVEDRSMWQNYLDKNAQHATNMSAAHEELQELFRKEAKTGSAIEKLVKPTITAKSDLRQVATLGKDGWVKKTAEAGKAEITDEAFTKAVNAYNESVKKLESFVSGKEKAGNIEVPEVMKKAYEKSLEATNKVKSGMEGMLSYANLVGPRKAIEHNLEGLQFWKKDVLKGRRGEIAIRGGIVLAGAALTVDSLARGKGKDEEPRSVIGRITEGAVGILGVAGGLTVARAL